MSHSADMQVPPSPTSTTSSAKIRRDTGFPDMFFGTNLHHPDADTSPNASISAEDVNPAQAPRRRFTKLIRSRNSLAHGKIGSSSESLAVTSSSGIDPDALTLELVSVVMTPDGRISRELNVDDARASFEAEMARRGSQGAAAKPKNILKTLFST
ncbi:uncharacterized protein DNG_00824 [Cephalotrichum gorgonifer]|uniref:Uncharacterized protein n=1 Tax=Cephalotrichum gorgonifer TaxID=2041049 RepID=A0AAE8MPY1_9PEZI|nr:uncharacterized protein DNG_00824 [Cephalotrichum gorgonifer]